MPMYEVEVNAIVKAIGESEEQALHLLRTKLGLWFDAKSIMISPATLIKKGNN